jgi:hypothetical protein
MKKRINKVVVVITAVLTVGALGAAAKTVHMHHKKHNAQFMNGNHEQGHCFMWEGCESDKVETEAVEIE